MIGLYVHIPFCARRCPYCDFAITVGARDDFKADYVRALRRELTTVLDEHAAIDGRTVSTIFFGGGTPTALDAGDLRDLMALIQDRASLDPSAEISIEANPDGLDEAKLAAIRAAGWNRVSFGVQSFDDESLRRIGRTHRAADIERVFAATRRAGFSNISLDLMFALPGQKRESWRSTLQQALSLGPEHLSCYALTIEGDTPFAKRVERGDMIPLDDDVQADLMADAVELTQAAGLERYEVSNYARPGYECRHNENYWRGGDYLAAGCGAHGHRNGHRWWNERDSRVYVAKMNEHGYARADEERLTPRERLNEITMLGVRTRAGFSLDEVSRKLQLDARRELKNALPELLERGILIERLDANADINALAPTVIALAPESFVVADAVAARLAI
jgi:oxygen-independent coproporphyrinogen-3 oxidase